MVFRAGGLDGALLDMDCPGWTGGRCWPSGPVVFLTANTDVDPAFELRALGARAVPHKPFDPLRIGAALTGALGWAA